MAALLIVILSFRHNFHFKVEGLQQAGKSVQKGMTALKKMQE
jgi:hypothetical protein